MRQQIFKMLDGAVHLLVLFFDLPAFERGQAAQLHIENGLCLQFAQLEALHQAGLGGIRIRQLADGLDDGIDIVERDQVAIQDVDACAGLVKFKLCAAHDDGLAMLDEDLQACA